jgi:DNA-binding beta-propeller fold protein YncE
MRISKRLALLTVIIFALTAGTAAAAVPAQFGTEGEGAGQLEEPRGIAIEQETGDVYIADRNNNRIDKFDKEGHFLLAWGWGVADGKTEALQTCTTTCFAGLFGAGSGQLAQRSAEGIAVDNSLSPLSHGDVYVLDAGNQRVEKFGPEGEFLLMFGGEVNATPSSTHPNVCLAGEACKAGVQGTEPGRFIGLNGRSIAVDSAGDVYVGDQERVQRFSASGVVEPPSRILLPAGSGFVENLAVDSTGDLYVKSSELPGIRKYDGAGAEVPPPRDEAGQAETNAIAVGPANELFVNDFEAGLHHILAFDAAGGQTASFDAGSEAQDAGKHGIAYSEVTKTIYVVNAGAVRIVNLLSLGPLVLEGSERAGEIQPASATLGATINPEEKASAEGEVKYHFEYGETPSYDLSTAAQASPGGAFEDRPVGAPVTALHPRTLYHFRVVLENAAKEVTDGPDRTFTTLPPVGIDSESVSQVNATSALLETELNPRGLATTYRFEYDTAPYGEGEADHGVKVPAPDGSAGSGTVDVARSEPIQGLEASRTYYYRVVAVNSLGEVVGPGHSFTTQGAAASVLPDHRAWELVSPPNKHGAPLESISEEGGVIQAAADGDALAYFAKAPPDQQPAGNRSVADTQLVAKRGATGWSSEDIATPHEAPAGIIPGSLSEYKLFSSSASAAIVEPEGVTPLSTETTERTPYLRDGTNGFIPLVNGGNVPEGTKFQGQEVKPGVFAGGVSFVTGTPDLAHLLVSSPSALTKGFDTAGENAIYEWSEGTLTPVSILPSKESAGAVGNVSVGNQDDQMRGALSNDGRFVYFNAGSPKHLYRRDLATAQTTMLDEPQPGVNAHEAPAEFQIASADGKRAYFTDTARLTKDARARTNEPDLYMCEFVIEGEQDACRLTDVTSQSASGEVADVLGSVIGTSESGSVVYFVAQGALTSGAAHGTCGTGAEAEECMNLYSYDVTSKAISHIADLSSRDFPDWFAQGNINLGELTSRVSPNGEYLAFMSERSLTGYDNRDVANASQRDEEVYLYRRSSGDLTCVSCNPSGARPAGVLDTGEFPGLLADRPGLWKQQGLAASIPGWTRVDVSHALYQSRYLSNSGRLFFDAADALVPQDSNGVMDVYEYEPTGGEGGVGGPQSPGQPASNSCTTESSTYSAKSGGCVNLISAGTSPEESAFLDASENGDDVFFLTASKLAPQDVDSALDVYDAHVCSAASPCPPPPPAPPPACEGDACQNPVAAPNDATPGSLTFHGPGNLAAKPAVKAKARPLTRAQKLSRALKVCRRDKKKVKRTQCERLARGKFGAVKTKKAKPRGKSKR